MVNYAPLTVASIMDTSGPRGFFEIPKFTVFWSLGHVEKLIYEDEMGVHANRLTHRHRARLP